MSVNDPAHDEAKVEQGVSSGLTSIAVQYGADFQGHLVHGHGLLHEPAFRLLDSAAFGHVIEIP